MNLVIGGWKYCMTSYGIIRYGIHLHMLSENNREKIRLL